MLVKFDTAMSQNLVVWLFKCLFFFPNLCACRLDLSFFFILIFCKPDACVRKGFFPLFFNIISGSDEKVSYDTLFTGVE